MQRMEVERDNDGSQRISFFNPIILDVDNIILATGPAIDFDTKVSPVVIRTAIGRVVDSSAIHMQPVLIDDAVNVTTTGVLTFFPATTVITSTTTTVTSTNSYVSVSRQAMGDVDQVMGDVNDNGQDH